jgi:hypothetical protein
MPKFVGLVSHEGHLYALTDDGCLLLVDLSRMTYMQLMLLEKS